MKPLKICLYFLLLFHISACTRDIDFDQINDVNLYPEVIVNLAFFNLTAPNLLNNSNLEIPSISNIVAVPFLRGMSGYLEKVEFIIAADNEFNREFVFKIDFINEFGNPIYSVQPAIHIPSNSMDFYTIIEVAQEGLLKLEETFYLEFSMEFPPSSDGSILNNGDLSIFNLKSAGKFYLNY